MSDDASGKADDGTDQAGGTADDQAADTADGQAGDTDDDQAGGTADDQAGGTADGQAADTADDQAGSTADDQAGGTDDDQAADTADDQAGGTHDVEGEAGGRTDEPTVRHAEPPLPDVAFTVVNPLVSLVLRSPLHGLVSDSLLLLAFEGRKSGDEYTTPVGYRQAGETLYVTTHSPWWRNLEGGQPVTVRLRGEERRGIATPTTDPDVVTEHVREYLAEHGVDAGPRVGVVIEGDEVPDDERLRAGVEGTVLIEIDLSADVE